MHWIVGLLCWAAVALTLAFAVCRLLGLWTQTQSWLKSSKEEKANLTRSDIYSANGYLIKSEMDDYGRDNSHKFELVEIEYPMVIFPIKETAIPPQPLRPAPATLPKETKINNQQSISSLENVEQQREKVDSFYHYNISTATTQSIISSSKVESINSQVIPESKRLDEIIVLEDGDGNDWMTRNNLNIFKKPEYKSTNPFHTSGQCNPFSSQDAASSNELNIEPQYNELSNACDNQSDNIVSRSGSLRKLSYDDVICENDDTPAVASSGSTVRFRRAISCDSVSSDTSLGPLESPLPSVTGQLCLSLRCFRINSNDSLLAVNVIEARSLLGDCPDTYVEIFLSPEHKGGHFKTKICRGTNCPSYNETYLVDIGKSNKRLCFHVYNTENESCSLIGEAELSLQDAGSYKQPVTTWLTLTDAGQGIVKFGELMLSLSYLPTAERLTLIITRARRLPDPTDYNIFFKVYLQKNGKKVAKKRSSIKRSETSPTFNEAFIFSVPPNLLSSIELRITLVYFPIGIDYSDISLHQKIGHVILYHNAQGKPGNHWNQMLSSLRKPVSMWHTLRRPQL